MNEYIALNKFVIKIYGAARAKKIFRLPFPQSSRETLILKVNETSRGKSCTLFDARSVFSMQAVFRAVARINRPVNTWKLNANFMRRLWQQK